MDKVVYVISDLHLSAGVDAQTGQWDKIEDFRADDAFCAFLDRISADNPSGTELVIAGDFLEYPQTLPEIGLTSPADHLSTTEAESLERTRVIMGLWPERSSGHPRVFARLRQFMEDGHSVTILVGNHDIDLFWESVWAMLFDAIYPPGAAGDLRLIPFSYVVGRAARGRIYIEHGNERDTANAFGEQMREIFAVDAQGVKRLKRCWGTLFVDKVYNDLERRLWFIDNIKPILRVIKLGLRNDFFFTATALALIAKFVITRGTPGTLLGESGVLGPQAPPDADSVVAAIEDAALRDVLAQQLADPTLRAEFEQTVQAFSPEEQQIIRVGSSGQPSLEEAGAAPTGTRPAPVADPEAGVLGFFGEEEDEYRKSARTILQDDPRITAVIMGHTHAPIDGLLKPIYLDGGRTGYYYNSGTWTPHLRDRAD